MSSFLQIQDLCFLITEALSPFESAAILNGDGQILGMKYANLSDIGTFGPLIQTVAKYFPLQEGDAVMTNDPYSGGTTLSEIGFVTSFQINDQKFYFAARTRFKPRLAYAKRLEDEGVRVPPTPIAHDKKINEVILTAIGAHPLAPQGLQERVTEKLEKIWGQIDLLKTWCKHNPNMMSKAAQKTLLAETKNRIQRKLSDLPRGELRTELQFETGEILKLHTELKSNEIHFDFAGTSNSKRLFLTDLATHGTCLGAFLSFLGEDFLLNEGAYSTVNVTTPKGSFLNAKYPSPVFEGMAEGSSMLGSAVLQSLSQIASTKSIALNGSVPTIVSFEFSSGKIYFDALAGGTGATSDSNGLDGYYFWSLARGQTSVEEIEGLYPLHIRQSGIRQSSGGKGKFTGGNGILREIELNEDCSLKWLLGHRHTQVKGLKGALGGHASEITIVSLNGDKVVITENHGEMKLKKGDKLIAASAGGGGFGKTN